MFTTEVHKRRKGFQFHPLCSCKSFLSGPLQLESRRRGIEASEMKLCLALPKVKVTSLYFSLKVTNTESLYGVKIMKIRAIENLTLGHLKPET